MSGEDLCAHAPMWSSSTSAPGVKELQQGACLYCGAYALYQNGEWKFGAPPQKVYQLAAKLHTAEAERDTLLPLIDELLREVALSRPSFKLHAAANEVAKAVGYAG